MSTEHGSLTGPMVVVTWLLAIAWLGLAVFGFVGLEQPWAGLVGGAGVVGALGTAWLGSQLRVVWDADGVLLPGHGHVPWEALQAVVLEPGWLTVPVVEVRRGHRTEPVTLDGLAWFGGADGVARDLAERLSAVAGLGPVRVRAGGARGRRQR